MKYYYEKPEEWIGAGETIMVKHPLFNRCTLFRDGKRGLCIVQEYFNEKTKVRWWSSIEPWLSGDIYFSPGFRDYFDKNAAEPGEDGLYPVVTVRKIMWALRIKPLRKEYWEEEI